MVGHRHGAGTGRHAEPETVERALTAVPALPTPRPPLEGLATGLTTGSRGPATGSRGPATGSRGPATGSRRAPGRRRHWVPIALAIWIASFLAVPAAVLVHQAVTDDDTPVVEAGETHGGTGTAPAAGGGSQAPVGPAAPGARATSVAGGGQLAGDPTIPGTVDPGIPAAEVVQGQIVVPGSVVPSGSPAAATSAGTAAPSGGAAAPSPTPGSNRPTSAVPTTASSPPVSDPAVQEPPVEAAQPGTAQDVSTG